MIVTRADFDRFLESKREETKFGDTAGRHHDCSEKEEDFNARTRSVSAEVQVPELDEHRVQELVKLLADGSSTESQNFLDFEVERSNTKLATLDEILQLVTNRPLKVDGDQNVILELDMSDPQDRDFVQYLGSTKLPEMYRVKLINFYECDELIE